MAGDRDTLRDWHRLFGLLLTDFFTDSPFTVEIERDLSEQQQFLDVVILRRGRGRLAIRLPDGLEGLAEHNLITFKSHREALDAWAIKELIGHYVAYRKLISASPELVGFGRGAYRRRSERTSLLLGQLFETFRGEGLVMSYTMQDFERDYIKKHFAKLTPAERREVLESLPAKERREVLESLPAKERREVLESLPPEERLAGLSAEQVRSYLERLNGGSGGSPRKTRRKR